LRYASSQRVRGGEFENLLLIGQSVIEFGEPPPPLTRTNDSDVI
jgi:hypothetical protein